MKKFKFLLLLLPGFALLFLFSLSFIISPYKYEWDENIKQIDHDAILVLKLLYLLIFVLGIMNASLSYRINKIVAYACIAISVYVLIELIYLNIIE